MRDDDDDDEGFGDFNSAPSTTVPAVVDGDDDWGDFMSNSYGGLAHASSLPGTFFSSKPAIGLGLPPVDPNSDPVEPGSAPGRVAANSARWDKPKVAIPLSIFGLEEEEGSDAGYSTAFVGEGGNFAKTRSGGGANLDDLIANLRKGGRPENGLDLALNGSAKVESVAGEVSNLVGAELSSSPNAYVNDKNEVGLATIGLGLKWDPFDLYPSGFGSVVKEGIPCANGVIPSLVGAVEGIANGGGVDEEEGEDGWEFKASEEKVAAREEFPQGCLTRNGGSSNVNIPGSELGNGVFPLGPAGMSLNLGQAASNKQQSTANTANYNEDSDEAVEWGFKSAQLVLQLDGGSKDQPMKIENMPTCGSDAQHCRWNIFDWSMILTNSNIEGMNSGERDVNLNSVDGSEDFADDAWEFKAAESEPEVSGLNSKVDMGGPSNLGNTVVASGFGNVATSNEDLFASLQVPSQKPGESDFGFGFSLSSVADNNTASHTIVHNNVGNGLRFSPADGNFLSGEDSWAFKDTSLETVDGDKAKGPTLESQKRALPLSIFGEEEIESDNPVIIEDISTEIPMSKTISGFKNSNPNMSIIDLISSLYSQMEHSRSRDQAVSHHENGSGLTTSMIDSNLSHRDDDNFDDDSWEFQDATSGNGFEDQNRNLANVYANESADIELKDCLNLFIKLKEELLFAALAHFENLKKAQNAGAVTVNDDEINTLHKEIQGIGNDLGKHSIVSTARAPKETNLNNFVEILQEPKFRLFEAEYEISKKLLMAEKDSGSVIQLLKLVASIVRILSLVSQEDQLSYVFTWSKILAACARELRHGALIWKNLLEKNAHHRLLSEARGKDYVLSLGEIYRVAEVLGSSARLYKPWIYANSVDSMSLLTLLNECVSLWSTSGLEEALQTLIDSSHFEESTNHRTLVESIKYICDMDVDALYNSVFFREEPTCQLSLLKAFPGMQMVFWDGKPYLVTLANLWANLINCDPPILPSIRFR